MALNIDAAYAGPSWLIPHYREKTKGLELADSILLNFGKSMGVNLPGTACYINNKNDLIKGMGG